jgi:hypothetical protein
LELTFTNARLARLCGRQAELAAWAGEDAPALEQLLAELDSVDKLGEVEEFPHVHLLRAPVGRVGAHGAYDAGVLLNPEPTRSRSYRDADAATVVAVAVGDEDFNPEGASWPRAFAMSRTTR